MGMILNKKRNEVCVEGRLGEKMKKQRVTARDVAQRAGVSTTTVSMILNGRGDVKFPEKTCRRVLNACEELGYVRKSTFRSSDSDNRVLVAIVPSLSNLYYVSMAEAMQQKARELGYSLLIFDTFRDMQQENRIMNICSQDPFVGILILYPLENSLLLHQTGWNKPIIHIYDKNAHRNGDILEFDSFRTGTMIGEHLINLGHERIAFISANLESKQVARIQRLEGLQTAFREHGFDSMDSVTACTPELEHLTEGITSEGYELGYLMAKRLMDRHEDVTAFVGSNDMIAFGAMDAVLDAGKRVPNDYSICGCGNASVTKYRSVSLTTVECYAIQSGREAVDMLVRKLEGIATTEEEPGGITRIEYFPKLIVRKSTGPRRK